MDLLSLIYYSSFSTSTNQEEWKNKHLFLPNIIKIDRRNGDYWLADEISSTLRNHLKNAISSCQEIESKCMEKRPHKFELKRVELNQSWIPRNHS